MRIQLSNTLLGIFSQRLIPRIEGGVIPAYEVLVNTTATANLIRVGKTNEINIAIETGRQEGMLDMNHSLADLVVRGEIALETALVHSINPAALEKMI